MRLRTHLHIPAEAQPERTVAMTNIELNILKSLTTQLCDAIDALTDALHEAGAELRALQETPPMPWTAKEHVLVPPPPLPGPSL